MRYLIYGIPPHGDFSTCIACSTDPQFVQEECKRREDAGWTQVRIIDTEADLREFVRDREIERRTRSDNQ